MILLKNKLSKRISISYLIAFLSIISLSEKPVFAQVDANEVTQTKVENINLSNFLMFVN
ncbi:hypothetical protein NIES4102_42090 (plasmid) [Chondrocystis sp. NIES-4102]|nr:hypothetical protein NIES4102_42090 [Chondrocystis sp. NIES-4102]